MGGACEKKTTTPDPGVGPALDKTDAATTPPGPVDTTPLTGIDISKLDGDKKDTFYKLIGSLKSPCGKGESLRVSYTKDTSCKRAPFAVRLVVAMLEDEFPEDKAREDYVAKYDNPKTFKIDTSKAPKIGTGDTPVKLVEFFDYGCPHCKEHAPVFAQIAQQYEGKVTEYFMMFPLGHWPDSKGAAQAAYAAYAQGKFKEMHELLFARAPSHAKDKVMQMAAELKLDAAKFEAVYNDSAKQVDLDKATGDSVGVDSTPTVFLNDRKYEGPITVKYLGLWIDEEIAVNR
jgi:protein-disulfide isomerase